MLLLTFNFKSLSISPPLVFTRLLKKINIRLYLGSAHTQVPVNPVCPKVKGEADLHGYGVALAALSFSGLSKPRPRRLIGELYEVKSLIVSSLIYLRPLYSPPFSSICIITARSLTSLNKPACP